MYRVTVHRFMFLCAFSQMDRDSSLDIVFTDSSSSFLFSIFRELKYVQFVYLGTHTHTRVRVCTSKYTYMTPSHVHTRNKQTHCRRSIMFTYVKNWTVQEMCHVERKQLREQEQVRENVRTPVYTYCLHAWVRACVAEREKERKKKKKKR